ncbi:hypothetical protein TWF225_001782 [Orbilia oligospora]|nr:hypothetical protein TWF225_001782 [Orbilia oligospora]KAF3255733.1 hypothetical protein TWF217_006550 [Orbilia oligospora]KAF3265158.1 hypothetical protein TWF128_000452 [Orbilia oligospora]KAF3278441.1 hypothetical protein TWF132_001157 [Orbilia oligospora]
MFYIPKTTPSRRISLKSKSNQSPARAFQNASKRVFDCMIQSLATISLAYGHYPVMPPPTYHHQNPHQNQNQRQRQPARPNTSCGVHSVPDKIARNHNEKERQKVQLVAKPRPKSEVIYLRRNEFQDSIDSLADTGYREVHAREFL